jgi:hypothetical protein
MKRISSWDSSKLLTASSFFFTIPGIYSYIHYNLICSPLLLFTTSIISANYWRNALDDWRRQLDLYFSKIAFCCFTYNTLKYVPEQTLITIGLPNLYGLGYCFYKSNTCYKEEKKCWKYYHFGFHSLMTFQLFITMTYMGKHYMKQLKN